MIIGRRMLLGACVLAPWSVQAQIRLELKLEHERFLQFEPVNAVATIENGTDKPVAIAGGSEDAKARLWFLVEKRPDTLVRRLREGAIAGQLRIDAAGKSEVMVCLSTWYDLMEEGGYAVTAMLDWGGETVSSRRIRFEVESGLGLGSVAKPAPSAPGESRVYSLRYMARERHERLFLRVDEPDRGLNYGSFELGPLIRVFKPRIQVDQAGTVAIEHQSGSDCFTRSVFKSQSDKVVFVDQKYYRSNGQPYQFGEKKPE
jgi:hypothetical protein